MKKKYVVGVTYEEWMTIEVEAVSEADAKHKVMYMSVDELRQEDEQGECDKYIHSIEELT
jgi:hypothetical protein